MPVVADLLVAESQLVVGESDRARVVRELGVLQGARVQRDRARLFAARKRQAAVQAPERREARVGERLAHGVRRAAERRGGLAQVVLEQPGRGERRAHRGFVVFVQRAGAEQRRQQLRGFDAAAAIEGDVRPAERRLRRSSSHAGGYKVYRPSDAV